MGEEAAGSLPVVGHAVDEVWSALSEHADVVMELFGRVSSELRTGFAPAVDSFLGFFHAVDWKVCTIPLDTAKVRLQLKRNVGAGARDVAPTLPKYRGNELFSFYI